MIIPRSGKYIVRVVRSSMVKVTDIQVILLSQYSLF